MARENWLRSYLRRNPSLSVRKSEGVSLARVRGMNIGYVDVYFDLLVNTLEEYRLFDKPDIYNTTSAAITSRLKGETITTFIYCCNEEGTFIPTVPMHIHGEKQNIVIRRQNAPGSGVFISEI